MNWTTRLSLIGALLLVASGLASGQVVLGDERMELYLPLIEGRSVGVVCNHTAVVGGVHLVDTLRRSGVEVRAVFAPEHGFRGKAAAGAHIENGVDPDRGLNVFSLYGKTRKPTAQMLEGLDVIVFDIADVGVRFYTYLSTLHYVMEAAAEHHLKVIVLDRPNPNGAMTDGPILDTAFRSFVGMHPLPMAHGMTLGELSEMINGEGWLKKGADHEPLRCDLSVIDCENWHRLQPWPLAIAPSPNLPNANAIALYPSLCLFEATAASIGRGTDRPFECVGYPGFPYGTFHFTPSPCEAAPNPKHENVLCSGQLLVPTATETTASAKDQLELGRLISYRRAWEHGRDTSNAGPFINRPGFFDKLAGTNVLRLQIESGMSMDAIRESWATGLADFKMQRAPYLRYPD
jgi:uncharacterized protein YbbC (DUF1343 family)